MQKREMQKVDIALVGLEIVTIMEEFYRIDLVIGDA
jgi:hypothetical protein